MRAKYYNNYSFGFNDNIDVNEIDDYNIINIKHYNNKEGFDKLNNIHNNNNVSNYNINSNTYNYNVSNTYNYNVSNTYNYNVGNNSVNSEGVSIILPCYNKEKNIKMTIENLEEQTIITNNICDVEIICIEDHGTDNTISIIENLQRLYKNIKLYKNKDNLGVYAARLIGIQKATKKYIAFMDPDDYADITYYEELYKAAINSGADITQTPSVKKDFGKGKIELANRWFSNMPEGIYNVNVNTFNNLTQGNWFVMWNRMFTKECLQQISYYQIGKKINFLEDLLIYLCALMSSKKLCNVKTNGYYYYYLADDVEHLSKQKDRTDPVVNLFVIMDAYIMETKNSRYYDCIYNIRKGYIKMFAKEYTKMFNCVENFEVFNSIPSSYRQKERDYIKNIYISLLKADSYG